MKNNQQSNENIHFNITHRTSNAELQNSKNLHNNQTIRQQRHPAKAIEDQIIQTLNQNALTEIIQVSIKEYLHQLLVAVKQQEEAKKKKKKKKETGKLPQNKLRIIYANAIVIKSKRQSLKQIILSEPCHIFAITETILKDNEKINTQHFKWIGLNRKNKDGGGIGFLINKSILKSCTIEPNSNKAI